MEESENEAEFVIPKWRRKNVNGAPEIEAVKVTKKHADEIAEWCGGTVIADPSGVAGILVPIYGLKELVVPGDYIVKDTGGLFHKRIPIIFRATYNRLPETE